MRKEESRNNAYRVFRGEGKGECNKTPEENVNQSGGSEKMITKEEAKWRKRIEVMFFRVLRRQRREDR